MAQTKNEDFSPRLVTLSRLFKALAHPARLAIVETLAKKESCICGEIVEVLPLAQSTVSQHLKELKQAGIITGEVEGSTSCYCLNPEALAELQKLAAALFKTLDKNICCKEIPYGK